MWASDQWRKLIRIRANKANSRQQFYLQAWEIIEKFGGLISHVNQFDKWLDGSG
jgi:hypothetical protein